VIPFSLMQVNVCLCFVSLMTNFQAKGGMRCGVELDEGVGKNNGTVGGLEYFSCADAHGALVDPGKVQIIDADATTTVDATADAAAAEKAVAEEKAAAEQESRKAEDAVAVAAASAAALAKDADEAKAAADAVAANAQAAAEQEAAEANAAAAETATKAAEAKEAQAAAETEVATKAAEAKVAQAAAEAEAATQAAEAKVAQAAAEAEEAATKKAANEKLPAAEKITRADAAKPNVAATASLEEKKAKLTESGEDLTIWYHNIEKKESEGFILDDNGKEVSGKFLIRPKNIKADKQGNDWILTVVYKGKPTHHALDRKDLGDTIRFNKTSTTSTTLGGLVDFLRSKNKKWPVPLTIGVENADNMQVQATSSSVKPEKATPAPGKLKGMAAWHDNLEPQAEPSKKQASPPPLTPPTSGKGVAGAFQMAVARQEAEKLSLVERMKLDKVGAAPLHSQGSVRRFEGHLRSKSAEEVEKTSNADMRATFSAAGEHYGSQIERQKEAAARKQATESQAVREKDARDRSDAARKATADAAAEKKAEYVRTHSDLESRVGFSGLNLKKTSSGTNTLSRRKEKYGTHPMIGSATGLWAEDE
jgi:hypothetical protein